MNAAPHVNLAHSNVNVEQELEGSYWISLSMIALFENVSEPKDQNKLQQEERKICMSRSILGLFVTKDTLSRALHDEQHMFT